MPNSLKNLVKSAIKQTTKIISKTKAGSYFFDLALNESMNRITSIVYNGVELSFATPNQLKCLLTRHLEIHTTKFGLDLDFPSTNYKLC
ncbi:hypothetical protein NIES932_28480 [Raphidiopsis curvata NIES-932]|jgi:hypothetical protein|nr:hypothetical protein NIES932_28480 [Raphidiopsis curvata NIES-932]